MSADWSLRHLSVASDDKSTLLLQDVNAEFKQGRITLIIGSNGAGKSTLLEAMAGLRRVNGGDISLGGEPLWLRKRRKPLNRQVLLRFGLAMQHSESQWFAATVREEFRYSLRPYGNSEPEELERRISAALEATGLTSSVLEKDPWTLSGGQQRRLALACLHACEPDWLLLDEPTAGLDAGGRAALCKLLEANRASGKGAIIVTHDLETLLPLADAVMVVERGYVREAREAELPRQEEPHAFARRLAERAKNLSDSDEILSPSGASTDVAAPSKQAADHAANARPWQKPHTFDPRAVIAAYLLLSSVLLLQNTLPKLALAAFVVAVAVTPFWPLFRQWMPVIRGYAVLTIILVAIGGLSLQPLTLQWDRMETAAVRLVQLMLIMVVGMPILGLMTPLRLQRALDQTFGWLSKLSIPVQSLTLLVTLIFRFIPLLQREWARFAKLVRARGKETKASGSVPAKQLIYMLIPYLRANLRLADEMATALEARGFGQPRKQAVYGFKLRPTGADGWLLTAALSGFAVLFLIHRLL